MVADGAVPGWAGDATLAECKGNRTHAAKKLGISRRALIYKLRAIEAGQ